MKDVLLSFLNKTVMVGGGPLGNLEDYPLLLCTYYFPYILGDPPCFASELNSQKSLERIILYRFVPELRS